MVDSPTKPTVYIETTVISYLTGWPSRDIVRAAHHQITREWWDVHRSRFDVVASELVVTDSATELAEHLVRRGAVPSKAVADALHVGLAAANGVDFVMTWNCRHLANAFMRSTIEAACVDRGFRPPIICTPESLSGGVDHER